MAIVHMLVFGVLVLGLALVLVLLPAVALSVVLRFFTNPSARRPAVAVRAVAATPDDIGGGVIHLFERALPGAPKGRWAGPPGGSASSVAGTESPVGGRASRSRAGTSSRCTTA